jgi:16S rRNA (guanine527-N7)-methyltransferase
MNSNFASILTQNGILLDQIQVDKVLQFGALVATYNKKANLISEGDIPKIETRHLLDSLQPIRHPDIIPPSGSRWADMGSGAGFPVLPLSIALPEIQFFAIEPRQKRFTFLKVVRSELKLANLNIIEGDAESYSGDYFDRVSCRALGSAEEDWTRANRILSPNGVFVTLKSLRDCEGYAQPTWDVRPYDLPGESKPYCLLIRKKDHG